MKNKKDKKGPRHTQTEIYMESDGAKGGEAGRAREGRARKEASDEAV